MRQIRQAGGIINLHFEAVLVIAAWMSDNATCKFHIFIVYWAPVRNYPRVWRRWPQVSLRSEGVSARGGGVGHALVALTYIPEVAGTRWHRWLLQPRSTALPGFCAVYTTTAVPWKALHQPPSTGQNILRQTPQNQNWYPSICSNYILNLGLGSENDLYYPD